MRWAALPVAPMRRPPSGSARRPRALRLWPRAAVACRTTTGRRRRKGPLGGFGSARSESGCSFSAFPGPRPLVLLGSRDLLRPFAPLRNFVTDYLDGDDRRQLLGLGLRLCDLAELLR